MNKPLLQQSREKTAIIKSKSIYKGRIISLRSDEIQIENHAPYHYDIVLHPGAVAVIPIGKKGQIYFVRQWRRPISQILLELPAGTVHSGEDPHTCAQRELQEEIGFKAKNFISLGGFYTTPGFCDEFIHLFIATGLTRSPLPPDEHEMIEVVEMTLEEALVAIDNYRISDAKTILGILKYERYLKQISS